MEHLSDVYNGHVSPFWYWSPLLLLGTALSYRFHRGISSLRRLVANRSSAIADLAGSSSICNTQFQSISDFSNKRGALHIIEILRLHIIQARCIHLR